MGDPWGIGSFRGEGEEAQIEHIIKNNAPKNLKNRRNREKFPICSELFLLEMVYLALEPPLKWDLFRLMDCEKKSLKSIFF